MSRGLLAWGLPILLPHLLWSESLLTMLCLRAGQHTLNLHRTGLVNSAAHLWGDRPYDGSMAAAENIPVAMLTGRRYICH